METLLENQQKQTVELISLNSKQQLQTEKIIRLNEKQDTTIDKLNAQILELRNIALIGIESSNKLSGCGSKCMIGSDYGNR
jgi:hypothetical protein